MNIREMTKEDIEDFVILAKQLGYEAEKSHLNECIHNRNEDEIVFVAEKSGTVIGWINSKINQSYLSKPYCEIAGFVVDENERSRGTGKNLIRKVEIWAKDKGVHNIIVHSNIKRERAHNFYEVNGYNLIKKSKMFKKEL